MIYPAHNIQKTKGRPKPKYYESEQNEFHNASGPTDKTL